MRYLWCIPWLLLQIIVSPFVLAYIAGEWVLNWYTYTDRNIRNRITHDQ